MSAATIGTASGLCLHASVVPRLSAAPPSCLACCRSKHIASILLSTNPTSWCCTTLDKGMKMYCITIPDPGKQNASVRTSMLRPVLESSLTIHMPTITDKDFYSEHFFRISPFSKVLARGVLEFHLGTQFLHHVLHDYPRCAGTVLSSVAVPRLCGRPAMLRMPLSLSLHTLLIHDADLF